MVDEVEAEVVADVLPLVDDSVEDSVDSAVEDAVEDVDDAVELLDSDGSPVPGVGATSAGDGGAETVVVTGLDDDGAGLVELSDAGVTGLCVADVTGAGVLDGTSREAGGAALVAVDGEGACRAEVTGGAGAGDGGSGAGAGSGARVSDGASTV